jgi:putative phosphoesterase
VRILVLTDVHGNLAALDAVLGEAHDAAVCLGDLVGTGPEPAACVERIRSRALAVVQGNHDRAIADHVSPGGPEPFRSLAEATMPLAYEQLDGDALAYLGALPLSLSLTFGARRALLVHATPHEPLYRAVGPDPAAWAVELEGVEAEIVLVGHTHLPFELEVGPRRIVNPGSVGLPLDGDPRAAYAVVEDGVAALRRVAYPVERTVRALGRSGLSPLVMDELTRWLETGRAPTRTTPLPVGVSGPAQRRE